VAVNSAGNVYVAGSWNSRIQKVTPGGVVMTLAGNRNWEEMVGAMGDEAPAWAKRKLAKTPEDEPSSPERLVMLAEQEKFVVAGFGLDWEPGRKLEVEFPYYGPEAFDGVAYVSD
jgi:hypothetical protein